MQDSPLKYSNVRSSKERLGSMRAPLNAADYNTDTAGKQFIATGLEASPIKYSAMISSSPRLVHTRHAARARRAA